MKKGILLSALWLGAALTGAAQADDLGYKYLDLAYLSTSYSGGAGLDNGNGYLLRGSLALPENWLLQGSYSHVAADITNSGGVSLSMNHYNLGAGYRIALADKLDLVPSLAYASEHDSSSFASKSYSGYDLGLTLRGLATDQLEWKLRAVHTSAGIVGQSANLVGAGVAFRLNDRLAVGGEYAHASNNGLGINTLAIFGRVYF